MHRRVPRATVNVTVAEQRNKGRPTQNPRGKRVRRAIGSASMTALSITYPFAALAYFWYDWGQYVRDAWRVLFGTWGIALPVGEWGFTVLSPWRVALAGLTSAMLLSAAKKLRRGASDAKSFSLLTLFGMLLPQWVWLAEFMNDWQGGQGLGTATAAMAGVTALPAVMMHTRSEAAEPLGMLEGQHKTRVMAAAIGMGWLGMAAMSVIDHSYQLFGASIAPAAITTMLLAALSMVGLFRQKSWSLLTALGAAGAAGATAVQVSNSAILGTGTAMDTAFATVAAAPIVSAALPALVLLAVLSPFYKGMFTHLAGAPGATVSPARVRVDVGEQPVDADEHIEAAEQAAERGREDNGHSAE